MFSYRLYTVLVSPCALYVSILPLKSSVRVPGNISGWGDVLVIARKKNLRNSLSPLVIMQISFAALALHEADHQ
jgi:hypothetical protein